ncbi:hypothetical protein AXF42_Ash001800 [Apostasia shenzhenica]|uniref:GrpE protein homolog n=1 Tax=Apostasia shenzhenica TaxID=1088818 RepID=A0A2I0AB96_9ASPA|nr:hypothetical protein AXF42_Ash001800 [Apostasia shenzhenica]
MAWRHLPCIQRSNLRFLIARASSQPDLPCSFSNTSLYVSSSSEKLPSPMSKLRHSNLTSIFQRFGFSSSAFPQASKREINQLGDDNSSKTYEASQKTSEDEGALNISEAASDSTTPDHSHFADLNSKSEQVESPSLQKRRRRATRRTTFSDSDAETELSVEELAKLVAEKDEILKARKKEIENMQEKVLRAYAEMENVLERTKREVENSKKYGIQNFAKGLLDVADNLGRASNAIKEKFSEIDRSSVSVGLGLLKSLLEGVEMTDKQLAEVFRKFGIEKYVPLNENFDPNQHNAVFEMPDESKPPGTVAVVLKAGYMLHDRVIRPAEVGVIKSVNGDGNQSVGGSSL